MKPNIIFCLALVLSSGLFNQCAVAQSVERPFNPGVTNVPHGDFDAAVVTNWSNTRVSLYRNTGGPMQLDAKQIYVTEQTGAYRMEANLVAVVDPETGSAWVGPVGWWEPHFFLETEAGIVCGRVAFMATALGFPHGAENEFNGNAAGGAVYWSYSYVNKVNRGEGTDAAIKKFADELKVSGGWRGLWRTNFEHELTTKPLTRTDFPFSKSGKGGLNAWLFMANQHAQTNMTVQRVEAGDGMLRLDLNGPDGEHAMGTPGIHTGSVWIDLKTWNVVKTIQDGLNVNVADIKITFAQPPTVPARGLSGEAMYPPGMDPNEHGAFTNIVAGQIAALNVTWADTNRFKTEMQTCDFLRELLSNTNTQTYTGHIWSYGDGEPSIVANVEHTTGKPGQWVIWCSPNVAWAYQDENGKWWWGMWDSLKSPKPKSLNTP